jgi:hypothetical protein
MHVFTLVYNININTFERYKALEPDNINEIIIIDI